MLTSLDIYLRCCGAFNGGGAVRKLILDGQLAVIELFVRFLSLIQLPLEKKPVFLVAQQEFFHPRAPGIEDCLTDGFSH